MDSLLAGNDGMALRAVVRGISHYIESGEKIYSDFYQADSDKNASK